MKSFFYTVLVLTLFSLSSCKKEKEKSPGDYLIFGRFYGFCMGELCIETYKLDAANLYEDLNDNYSGAPFDFVQLGAEKFEETKDLINYFPNELLAQPDSTFGCPDCADQGGILISYYANEELKTWRVDNNRSAVPSYLHAFMDKIDDKIDLINQ